MYGRKVKLRFFFIFLILITLVLSIFLIIKSLEENVIYFKSPTEIKVLSEVPRVSLAACKLNRFISMRLSIMEV